MIRVLSMRDRNPHKILEVNTTSRAKNRWEQELSPFNLGPVIVKLPNGEVVPSKNVENAWQFTKVYEEHVDPSTGLPHAGWRIWAEYEGFRANRAVRYPKGKGAKPLYSWWRGEKLGYIQARKEIYVPLYASAVMFTSGFHKLKKLFQEEADIALRDFDGYDHDALGMSLSDVLNDPSRKCGHAFVLKMLLTGDEALDQCGLTF